jgi:hypothetical protein
LFQLALSTYAWPSLPLTSRPSQPVQTSRSEVSCDQREQELTLRGCDLQLFATSDSSAQLVSDAMKDPGTASAGFEASITGDNSAAGRLGTSALVLAALGAALFAVQMM